MIDRATSTIRRTAPRNGSVLVGLLWCLALLSVVVISVLHTARMDLQVARNTGDSIQARYLALAGIEKAKALLYHDARERQRSARHHTGSLSDSPTDFREVPLGRGVFSVLRQGGASEPRGLRYGVSDEESRLNINRASSEELSKIRGLTPDIIAAIQDWRDGDNAASPGGAELDYYASRRPPASPRNGPFATIRELLMVRDMPRSLFLEEDTNQNGLLDPNEDDGDSSLPQDNRDGVLNAGWAGLFTVDSSASDRSASGEDRVDLRSASEKELTAIPGITSDIARAIVAHRGRNQFESVADLLDVTAPAPPGSTPPANVVAPTANIPNSPNNPGTRPGQPANRGGTQGPSRGATATGPKVITAEILMDIADRLTVTGEDQAGAINLNTASAEVLACLPGLTEELARDIVAYRRSAGFLPNVAWLLKVDGMTQPLVKQLWPKVTVRSETFRVLSEGRIRSSGAWQRVEMVIRLRDGLFETISYREDL